MSTQINNISIIDKCDSILQTHYRYHQTAGTMVNQYTVMADLNFLLEQLLTSGKIIMYQVTDVEVEIDNTITAYINYTDAVYSTSSGNTTTIQAFSHRPIFTPKSTDTLDAFDRAMKGV